MTRRSDEFPGYLAPTRIHDGPEKTVYRAIRSQDRRPVILKLLKPAHATPMGLSRCRHEYEMICGLNSAHIIGAHALEQHEASMMLVLEDVGETSLDHLSREWHGAGTNGFGLSRFLVLARQIVSGIAGIHLAGAVHKDIGPSNIVLNSKTGELKIIDFDIATSLIREAPPLKSPRVLEGTLPYMSPEQTGRMNRTVDYRTDFYSLGVTFYQLLTGRLPFEAGDAMELVHSHLARTPIPPHVLNPAIPEPLSHLVLKLMAKAPEDRYQSARGLQEDLEFCYRSWESDGKIPGFDLGRDDRGDHFLIPEHLYGRDREVASLLAVFDRVSQGSTELVLVAGSPGIGKTAVVNQIHKPIVQRHGYYVRGKFDQFARTTPFAAFVQALQDLLGQLLGETDEQLQRWRAEILEAVGQNGQVIIDVIPELQRIIGPQPPVPDLPADAARNRFNLLFRRFLDTFTAAGHPLVLFLDDLQWADPASLELLQALLGASSKGYLLLVGAYRDNEVFPGHPLRLALAEIEKTGRAAVHSLTLAPLTESDVNELIADALGSSPALAWPLARLVYQKTRGNPFFNNQFLEALHRQGVLTYNREGGYWEYDTGRVPALAQTDDVVEFMSTQLQRLPSATEEVLKLAACIGSSFDLATLAVACQHSQVETASDIWAALQAGLVLPENFAYRFLHAGGDDAGNPFVTGSEVPRYRFLHDRVQQAAYSLIPQERRPLVHHRIGRLLLASGTELEREEKVFEIVHHLNRGCELLTDPAERSELARLNLQAGRRAKAATAYQEAAEYFSRAIELLTPGAWREQYSFALTLYESAAEAAYLSGEYGVMEEMVSAVCRNARTILDQVAVFEIKSRALAAQARMVESVKTGLQVLEMLGVSFPEHVTPADVQETLREVQLLHRERRIADLVELPEMADPARKAAMRILGSICPAAFLSSPMLYTLIILKQVGMSITAGNSPAAAFCYASYGLILCGAGEIDAGYEFGQLALRLLERMENRKAWQCRVSSVVYTFTTHWKNSVRETLAPLRSAFHTGLEIGDFEFAGYSAVLYCGYAYCAGIGKDLEEVRRETLSLSEAALQMKQLPAHYYLRMLLQAMEGATGAAPFSGRLRGEHYDEEVMQPQHLAAKDGMAMFYLHFHKLLLSYLFGDYRGAVAEAARTEKYLENATGFSYLPVFYLYDSLSRLALYRERSGEESTGELASRIQSNQDKLRRWARYGPMNCLHKYELVEAERCRAFGGKQNAREFYDRAIAGARAEGYIREEGTANELAAGLCLEQGDGEAAGRYLRQAWQCYMRWGAAAKAGDLKRRYPQWLDRGRAADEETAAEIPAGASLDLETVLKASNAIAGEIELKPLLKRLMRLVMENAGAQRGALILEHDGKWVIQAHGEADGEIEVLQAVDPQENRVSAGIIARVARTRTSLVLDDASVSGDFKGDPHILRHAVRSVICAPLVNQGRLSGIVYLENNLTAKAFSSERLQLLNLLSAQMALSLDNARLFEQARQELAVRKQAEGALRESEKRFRTILDSINDSVIVHDPATGEILDVNGAACGMYGYTREEILRLRVEDLSSGDAPYTNREGLAWLRRTMDEGPQLFEWCAKDKWGRLFWTEVSTRSAQIAGHDRALVVVRDVTERRRIGEQLERALSLLEALVEQSPVAMTVVSAPDLIVRYANRAAADLLGVTDPLSGLGRPIGDIERHKTWRDLDADGRPVKTDDLALMRALRGEVVRDQEKCVVRADGTRRWALVSAAPVYSPAGELLAALAVFSDITERKKAEAERTRLESDLAQAQKMESIGRLAGGVAHDFNNLLTVINGFTALAVQDRSATPELRSYLDEVSKAGERAADLTRQLLAFSRRQVIELKPLNPSQVIENMASMLRRLIGEDVDLVTILQSDTWTVLADKGQFEQVLMNLAVNSRDAMPEGGQLTVETINVVLDEALTSAHPGVQPGEYVMIACTDTGTGMDAETRERIFEPFFTTKQEGRGTGLGLATVFGIVRQSGGHIWVESEPGRGSTFKIFLPRTTAAAGEAQRAAGGPGQGHETVLVVDDDQTVRGYTIAALRSQGYITLEAGTVDAALSLLESHTGPIDLLLTDVVMPGMTGLKMAGIMRERRPGIKVLYMSGYTADVIARNGVLEQGVEFLPKPFSPAALGNKIRALLGKARGAA